MRSYWNHRFVVRRRPGLILVVAGVAAAATLSTTVAGAAPRERAADRVTAAVAPAMYATLLFARTQITAADDCVGDSAGIARLDTKVAPFLASQGMAGTGSMVTAVTKASARACVHYDESLTASWADATSLVQRYHWSFVSHTATYPADLAGLTVARSWAETCGSATTLDQHGLPGAHGLIAYPGSQSSPDTLQTSYASTCFDWGRRYLPTGVTSSAAAATSPYWQNTMAVNGGPCRLATAPCYTVSAIGGARYTLPSTVIATVNALKSGHWFTLQAYILVTGRSPAYTSNTTRWDCTAADPRLHWANDNERYCYRDWQRIVGAIKARPGIRVTDPQTVGIAWGRPDFR